MIKNFNDNYCVTIGLNQITHCNYIKYIGDGLLCIEFIIKKVTGFRGVFNTLKSLPKTPPKLIPKTAWKMS